MQSAYKLSSWFYSWLKTLWEDMYCFCMICERNSQSSTDYMVNGNIPCFSVQWISVCECMNHGSVSMMPHGLVYQRKLRCTDWMRCQSSVLQDAGIGTQHVLSTSSLCRLEMFFTRKVQDLHMSGEDVKCVCDVIVWSPRVLLLLWLRTRCTCWAQF
jgi:hypothetical protein